MVTVRSGKPHRGSPGNYRCRRCWRHRLFNFLQPRNRRKRRIQLLFLFFEKSCHLALHIIANLSSIQFPPNHFQSQIVDSFVELTAPKHQPEAHAFEGCEHTAELTIHIEYTGRMLLLKTEHRRAFHRHSHLYSMQGQDTIQPAFLRETEINNILQIHKRRALFEPNSPQLPVFRKFPIPLPPFLQTEEIPLQFCAFAYHVSIISFKVLQHTEKGVNECSSDPELFCSHMLEQELLESLGRIYEI